MSALGERRHGAELAFHTAAGLTSERMVLAVAAATRVKVDDAIVQAARPGTTPGSVVWHRTRARIVRAFEAAGFEVEL